MENKDKRQSSYKLLQGKFEASQKELSEIQDKVKNQKVKGNHISSTIPFVQTLFRIRQDIATFRSALIRAENLHYPNRIELYRLYKDVMLDAHLSSVIQTRKASILSTEFYVTKKGKEQKQFEQIFQTKWFYDWCNLSLDSMYFGFSLIEFGEIINEEFTSIKLVPREYVKPEFGIVGTTAADLTGASFLEAPWSNWCMGVGETMNLGLLAKAAPYVLWKKGAIMAYAEYCEVFGVPIRILKTDAFDEQTRQAGENFMRNLASSAYAVLGKDDEVQFAEAKGSHGASELFSGLMSKCNEEISKLLLGGTGMVDSKAFVGSSEIHQNNFLMICQQDKIYIQNIINYQLIPFLNLHGFGLEGCRVEVRPQEELNKKEMFEVVSKLLPFYDIPTEYIMETFGVPVEELGTLFKDEPAIIKPKAEPENTNIIEPKEQTADIVDESKEKPKDEEK